jgi:hypothetical protein
MERSEAQANEDLAQWAQSVPEAWEQPSTCDRTAVRDYTPTQPTSQLHSGVTAAVAMSLYLSLMSCGFVLAQWAEIIGDSHPKAVAFMAWFWLTAFACGLGITTWVKHWWLALKETNEMLRRTPS